MSLTVIALIVIAGLVFMLLEVLVVPGTTFVGIIGLLLMIVGIYFAYAKHGSMAGHLFLAGSALLSFIVVVLALKSDTWKTAKLETALTGKMNLVDAEKIKVNDTGKAVSRLTPMGKALINENYVEVESRSGYIDENSDIVVVKMRGSKIYVEPKA